MSEIEVIVFILLGLIILQDISNRIRRPALLYSMYIIVGVILGVFVRPKTEDFLQSVGSFGFLLLLFQIGLEIDLPKKWEAIVALRRAFFWMLVHLPIIGSVAYFMGLPAETGTLAVVALSSCSVGMCFTAWFSYPHSSTRSKRMILMWMVALEVLAIILFATMDAFLEYKFSWKTLGHIALVIFGILLIAFLADKLMLALKGLVHRTVRWRIHVIVLAVLAICALGNRLFGLSSVKTAFFLGLFVNRATHEGMALEHSLKPIAQKFLIPIFFLYLGTTIHPSSFVSVQCLYALLTTALIFSFRYTIYQLYWKNRLRTDKWTFLLVCPNLTMVAVAVHTYQSHFLGKQAVDSTVTHFSVWLLLTGLFVSIVSVLLLPPEEDPDNSISEAELADKMFYS